MIGPQFRKNSWRIIQNAARNFYGSILICRKEGCIVTRMSYFLFSIFYKKNCQIGTLCYITTHQFIFPKILVMIIKHMTIFWSLCTYENTERAINMNPDQECDLIQLVITKKASSTQVLYFEECRNLPIKKKICSSMQKSRILRSSYLH